MLAFLIFLAVGGFIVGALARFALPGPDPMPWYATIGLGIAGMVVGGFIGRVLFGHGAGFLLALVGGVIVLALYRKFVQRRPVFSAR